MFYTISTGGVCIPVINIKTVSISQLTIAIQQASIVTVTGGSYTAFTITTVGYRKVDLFAGISFRVRLSVSNIAQFELAVKEVYIEMMKAIYGVSYTADIQVSLIFQEEIVDISG